MFNNITGKNLIKMYYSYSYNQNNSSYKTLENMYLKKKWLENEQITNKTKIKYNILIVVLMYMLYYCEYFKITFNPSVIQKRLNFANFIYLFNIRFLNNTLDGILIVNKIFYVKT